MNALEGNGDNNIDDDAEEAGNGDVMFRHEEEDREIYDWKPKRGSSFKAQQDLAQRIFQTQTLGK